MFLVDVKNYQSVKALLKFSKVFFEFRSHLRNFRFSVATPLFLFVVGVWLLLLVEPNFAFVTGRTKHW